MKKLLLLCIFSLPFITGCALFDKNQKTDIPVTESKIIIDEKLLIPCTKLPSLEGTTYEDLASHYINTIGLYGTCSLKQDASIQALKKLQGSSK